MGEIQYVWADPSSSASQVALSSIAGALYENKRMAITRWVSKDGADQKMGLLHAVTPFDNVDAFLWIPVSLVFILRVYPNLIDHFSVLDALCG